MWRLSVREGRLSVSDTMPEPEPEPEPPLPADAEWGRLMTPSQVAVGLEPELASDMKPKDEARADSPVPQGVQSMDTEQVVEELVSVLGSSDEGAEAYRISQAAYLRNLLRRLGAESVSDLPNETALRIVPQMKLRQLPAHQSLRLGGMGMVVLSGSVVLGEAALPSLGRKRTVLGVGDDCMVQQGLELETILRAPTPEPGDADICSAGDTDATLLCFTGADVLLGLGDVELAAGFEVALQSAPTTRTEREVLMLTTMVSGLSFFEQLDFGLERYLCCQRLSRREYNAGAQVTRQGEDLSLLHVVTQGSFTVIVDDAERELLAPGACFGKLSVLRPQTAALSTVVANDTDSNCCATLSRNDLLEARVMVLERFEAALRTAPLLRTQEDVLLLSELLYRAIGPVLNATPGHELLPYMTDARSGPVGAHWGSAAPLVRLCATYLRHSNIEAGKSVAMPAGTLVLLLEGSGSHASVHSPEASSGRVPTELQNNWIDSGGQSWPQQHQATANTGLFGGKPIHPGTRPDVFRASTACKVALLLPADYYRAIRRSGMQRAVEQAWSLCEPVSATHGMVDKKAWVFMQAAVMRSLAPPEFFTEELCAGWVEEDWQDLVASIERTERLSSPAAGRTPGSVSTTAAAATAPAVVRRETKLTHHQFSEALMEQAEGWLGTQRGGHGLGMASDQQKQFWDALLGGEIDGVPIDMPPYMPFELTATADGQQSHWAEKAEEAALCGVFSVLTAPEAVHADFMLGWDRHEQTRPFSTYKERLAVWMRPTSQPSTVRSSVTPGTPAAEYRPVSPLNLPTPPRLPTPPSMAPAAQAPLPPPVVAAAMETNRQSSSGEEPPAVSFVAPPPPVASPRNVASPPTSYHSHAHGGGVEQQLTIQIIGPAQPGLAARKKAENDAKRLALAKQLFQYHRTGGGMGGADTPEKVVAGIKPRPVSPGKLAKQKGQHWSLRQAKPVVSDPERFTIHPKPPPEWVQRLTIPNRHHRDEVSKPQVLYVPPVIKHSMSEEERSFLALPMVGEVLSGSALKRSTSATGDVSADAVREPAEWERPQIPRPLPPDSHPDRIVATLPSGVPKEWVELHYASRKRDATSDPVALGLAKQAQLREWMEGHGIGEWLGRFVKAGLDDLPWLVAAIQRAEMAFEQLGLNEENADVGDFKKHALIKRYDLVTIDKIVNDTCVPGMVATKVRAALRAALDGTEELPLMERPDPRASAFDGAMAFTPIKEAFGKIAPNKFSPRRGHSSGAGNEQPGSTSYNEVVKPTAYGVVGKTPVNPLAKGAEVVPTPWRKIKTEEMVKPPPTVAAVADHKWYDEKGSLPAIEAAVEKKLGLSARSRLEQGSVEFWMRKAHSSSTGSPGTTTQAGGGETAHGADSSGSPRSVGAQPSWSSSGRRVYGKPWEQHSPVLSASGGLSPTSPSSPRSPQAQSARRLMTGGRTLSPRSMQRQRQFQTTLLDQQVMSRVNSAR